MKAFEKLDIHVEVECQQPVWGTLTEDQEIAKCEGIRREIMRHVDGVYNTRVVWTKRSYCSHCRAKWTEKSDTYNGGCCDEDEKNNPNPESAS